MPRRTAPNSIPPESERQFQEGVVQFALLRGWAVQHDRATNTPMICGPCSRRKRAAEGRGAVRYQCPSCRRPPPNIRNASGWPDLVLARPPRLIIVELKSQAGRVKPEQDRWLKLLRACPGIETYLWRPDDWDDIEGILL